MLRKLLPWVTLNRFANGQSFSPPSHEPEIWENLLSFTLVICFALLTSHLAHKENSCGKTAQTLRDSNEF